MVESVRQLRKICFKSGEQYGHIPFVSRKFIHPYVSIYITKILLILGFSGLQATLLMLCTNFLSLLALFLGGNLFYGLGGTLLILAWILDHGDGEVCRYRNESTSLGIYLDSLTHRVTYPAVYLIMGYTLFRDRDNITFLYLGVFSSFILNLTMAGRLEKKSISFYRDDIAYHYSSLGVAIRTLLKKKGPFRFLLHPFKYFNGMFMSGYGEWFDLLLIISAVTGLVREFFICFSIIVMMNWMLNFVTDLKYTFVK